MTAKFAKDRKDLLCVNLASFFAHFAVKEFRKSSVMSKYVLLVLLVLSGHILYAADDSVKINANVNVRNKWCSSKDSIFVFEGGFNLIQVYGKDVDPKDIRLRSSSGRFKVGDIEVKKDTAQAMVMPMEREGTYKLSVLSRKTGKILKEVTIYADSLSAPRASLGKIKGGLQEKKAILTESYLRIYYPNAYNYPCKIVSYSFKGKKGNIPMGKDVKGFEVGSDIKQLIKDIKAPDVIEFTNITAVCPECYDKTLKDLKIMVK